MADKLRVGIAGLNRAQAFADALNWSEHTEVVAVCDVDEERLAKNKEKFGNPVPYTDYYKMLETDLDLMVVASPLPFHVEMSIAALDKGLHVFCEVPAVAKLDEYGKLLAAVKRAKGKYMLGENCNYMRPLMIVKNMVRAGVFGDVYYAEGCYVHWVRFLDNPGGWREQYLLSRRGGTYQTHSLGPILDWLDDRVVTVSCMGTGPHVDPKLNGDDSSIMLCKTSKGALITLRNDLLSPRPMKGYAALQGTKGCYEPDWGHDDVLGDRVCFAPEEEKHVDLKWQPLAEFEEPYIPDMWRNQPEELKNAGHGGADGMTILDFVDAILNDRESPIDIYRALDMTLPGIISEYSSLRGGMPIQIPDFRNGVIIESPDQL